MSLERKSSQLEIIGDCVAKHWLPINTSDGTFLQNLHNGSRISLQECLEQQKIDIKPKAIKGLPNGGMVLVFEKKEEKITQYRLVTLENSHESFPTCRLLPDKSIELPGYYQSCEVSPDGGSLLCAQLIETQNIEDRELPEFYLIDAILFEQATVRKLDLEWSTPLFMTFLSSEYIAKVEPFGPVQIHSFRPDRVNYGDKKAYISSPYSLGEREFVTSPLVLSPDGKFLAVSGMSADLRPGFPDIYWAMIFKCKSEDLTYCFRAESKMPFSHPIWLDDNSLVYVEHDEKTNKQVLVRITSQFEREIITTDPTDKFLNAPGVGLIIKPTLSDTIRIIHFKYQNPLHEELNSTLSTFPKVINQLIIEYADSKEDDLLNGIFQMKISDGRIINRSRWIDCKESYAEKARVAARRLPLIGFFSLFQIPTRREELLIKGVALEILSERKLTDILKPIENTNSSPKASGP